MRITLTTLLCLIAAPATAQMACLFESECFEADGCMESTFALTVKAEGDVMTLETEFGDLPVVHASSEPGTLVALADDGSARYLLSQAPEGARLSVHMEGPLAVTYLGTCEGNL